MFIEFFYHLRGRGLPVSLTEFMTLLSALEAGHTESSPAQIYTLARSVRSTRRKPSHRRPGHTSGSHWERRGMVCTKSKEVV